MRDEDNEDPRGVAAPSDPHGEEEDGVGEDGHYAGEGDDVTTCEECGERVNRDGVLCKSCYTRNHGPTEVAGPGTQDAETEASSSWTFDRLGFAVVTAAIENLAIAYGKAALKKRDDFPPVPVGAEPRDTFDCLDDIQGEPDEVLQDDWPPLEAAIPLDSEHGQQVLSAALEELASADAPVLYDEAGSSLADADAIDDIRKSVDAHEDVWLVPGFLYDLTISGGQADGSRWVTKSKLKCVSHEKRTLHIFDGQQDRIAWWTCQECDEKRPGPFPAQD